MKRFVFFITAIFICATAFAQTIRWHANGNVIETTTCESGDNITPPTAPAKFGYTFKRWAEYIPIEYLESTGTQYIDTGVMQSLYAANLIVNATFQYTVYDNEQWLMGVSGGGYFMPLLTREGFFQSNIGVGGSDIKTQQIDTNKHVMICDSVNKVLTIDDTQYLYSSNNAYIPSNIFLFALNRGATGTAYGLSSIKLYSASFYTSTGVLIRDFIPALDKNGVPCLYDKVEKKYYYNAGTGDFITGPTI